MRPDYVHSFIGKDGLRVDVHEGDDFLKIGWSLDRVYFRLVEDPLPSEGWIRGEAERRLKAESYNEDLLLSMIGVVRTEKQLAIKPRKASPGELLSAQLNAVSRVKPYACEINEAGKIIDNAARLALLHWLDAIGESDPKLLNMMAAEELARVMANQPGNENRTIVSLLQKYIEVSDNPQWSAARLMKSLMGMRRDGKPILDMNDLPRNLDLFQEELLKVTKQIFLSKPHHSGENARYEQSAIFLYLAVATRLELHDWFDVVFKVSTSGLSGIARNLAEACITITNMRNIPPLSRPPFKPGEASPSNSSRNPS